jgi:hypothetical protein
MITKQEDFKRNSSQMTSWSFHNPDFIPPGMPTPKSLRVFIYELKYDGKPLFHTLTPEKSGIGQVFIFHNKHKHHARMMIMGMYVFVDHHYNGQGRKWFTADAIALRKVHSGIRTMELLSLLKTTSSKQRQPKTGWNI